MKNKLIKKWVSLIAACLAALNFILPAFAQNESGTIFLKMKYHDEAVVNGEIVLYHVGNLVEENTSYSYEFTDDFKSCNLDLNDLKNSDLPKLLCNFVYENNIKGTVKKVNLDGTVKFDNLQEGLYLVAQFKNSSGYNPITPFLVEIPSYNEANEKWEYEIEAQPKITLEDAEIPETTTQETYEPTEPTSGKLPHTGQLNWPIPVLAFLGIVLFAVGFSVYSGGKKK